MVGTSNDWIPGCLLVIIDALALVSFCPDRCLQPASAGKDVSKAGNDVAARDPNRLRHANKSA
jgi:hypothetical protein